MSFSKFSVKLGQYHSVFMMFSSRYKEAWFSSMLFKNEIWLVSCDEDFLFQEGLKITAYLFLKH